MILDIWVLKKDYTIVEYCKYYYDEIVIRGSDPSLLGPTCVAAPLSSPAHFGGSPASRAKPTARVWWSDSELVNNLVTPSLSPKRVFLWKNWWHAGSVHTGRRLLWIVSPGAISVWGEKNLRQTWGRITCIHVIPFFVMIEALPTWNPPRQPALYIVLNTEAFEENVFLTDQKDKLHLFTFSMSLRQSAWSARAVCGRSPSLVLINVILPH